MKRVLIAVLALSAATAFALDAIPPITRKLPAKGDPAAITDAERALITDQLEATLKRLPKIANSPARADAEVFTKAVELAMKYHEFYKKGDAKKALDQLKIANERIDSLLTGKTAWNNQRGNLVRGYISTIDGSAQPYGLWIPEKLDLAKPVPLYVWLHGRGDSNTDLHFIAGRLGTKPGQIAPENGIVLHAFGRQCIGWKSAGEIDIFEAIDDAARHYKIDHDRVALMGFSMGGAGAWHVGVHYADQFCVIHPGAGFADVKFYQKLTPETYPVWYEQVMWNLYDVPEYRRNFLNTPTVAYSGEDDAQRATGDYMVNIINGEKPGYVPHIIGLKMGHKYSPEGLAEVMKLVGAAVDKGRDTHPPEVHLQTRTLRYNRVFWVEALGLGEHWKDSRVEAALTSDKAMDVKTVNIAALKLYPPKAGWKQFPAGFEVNLDGKTIKLAKAANTIVIAGGKLADEAKLTSGLHKLHGLSGPMDDALYGPFLVVLPSGKSDHPLLQRWVDFEIAHFDDRWQSIYRGSLRTRKDTEVTADDIKNYHLILWGDAASNKLIEKIAGKLPITWTAGSIAVGKQKFDATNHVPLLVYPNPLNPKKYVVINSGNTFRENADRTNSLQNPKLPDWAVIDLGVLPDGDAPGKVVAADFFDENWQLKPRVVDPATKTIP